MDAATAPAGDTGGSGKTWADVTDNALHYLAAGALVGLVAAFAWYGKVSSDLFVVTITGAAATVGIKISK